mmetsp:Transcript_37437/g.109701  ORF Transcript_37437/g.109701 Transcript_37437/m.109701 type:complete len:327 (+) Transcript_37437:179-1159(+)
MLTTAARATATRRSPPVACPVRCQLLWAVPLTEPCALTTWKPAASKAAVASATCESGTSVKSVARPPPESVEHPRMEICDDASTDAIAATTPVSLRPASRMQIGIISSWWIPDSPAGDALQCSTHHGVSPANIDSSLSGDHVSETTACCPSSGSAKKRRRRSAPRCSGSYCFCSRRIVVGCSSSTSSGYECQCASPSAASSSVAPVERCATGESAWPEKQLRAAPSRARGTSTNSESYVDRWKTGISASASGLVRLAIAPTTSRTPSTRSTAHSVGSTSSPGTRSSRLESATIVTICSTQVIDTNLSSSVLSKKSSFSSSNMAAFR